MADQQDRCPGCGHSLTESTAPENERAYEGTMERCFACEAKSSAMADAQERGGSLDGMFFYAMRR